MDSRDVELIGKKKSFKGYFEIISYELKHRLFRGGWGEKIKREVFERGHAASALLYDPERDQIVLIEQFRVGAYAALDTEWYDKENMSPWLIEVVAGIIEEGESPEAVIRRECIEEAGCEITDIIPICQYLVTPGGSSEIMFSFCGRVSSSGISGIYGMPNEGEDIRAFALNSAEAFEMLETAKIHNSMTIIPLQWFQKNRDMVRNKWLTQ